MPGLSESYLRLHTAAKNLNNYKKQVEFYHGLIERFNVLNDEKATPVENLTLVLSRYKEALVELRKLESALADAKDKSPEEKAYKEYLTAAAVVLANLLKQAFELFQLHKAKLRVHIQQPLLAPLQKQIAETKAPEQRKKLEQELEEKREILAPKKLLAGYCALVDAQIAEVRKQEEKAAAVQVEPILASLSAAMNADGVDQWLRKVYRKIEKVEYQQNPDAQLMELLVAQGVSSNVRIRNTNLGRTTEIKISLIKRAVSFVHAAHIVFKGYPQFQINGMPHTDKINAAMAAILQAAEKFVEKTLAAKNLTTGSVLQHYIESELMEFMRDIGRHIAVSVGYEPSFITRTAMSVGYFSDDFLAKINKDLIKAERFANWERRSNLPIATVIQNRDATNVIIDTPLVHLTPDLIKDFDQVKSTNPPYWFKKLRKVEKCWILENLEKIKSGQIVSPPSTVRNVPSCANLAKHTNLHIKNGAVIIKQEAIRRSTLPPIDIKSVKENLPGDWPTYTERNRIAKLNAEQLLAVAKPVDVFNECFTAEFRAKLKAEWKNENIEFFLLDQSLLTPLPVVDGMQHGENNKIMRDETAKAMKAAVAKYKQGKFLGEGETNNVPINPGRGLPQRDNFFNYNYQIKLKLENFAKKICLVMFKDVAGFSAVNPFNNLDDHEKLVAFIAWTKTHHEWHKNFVEPNRAAKVKNFLIALQAMADQHLLWQECNGTSYSDQYKKYDHHNIELIFAAQNVLIVTGFGGVSSGGCKSGKDREGGLLAQNDAMLDRCGDKINLSKYDDTAEKGRIDHRIEHVDAFAKIFSCGQAQAVAGDNAYGSDGCMEGGDPVSDKIGGSSMYSADIKAELGTEFFKCQKALAKLNKPKIDLEAHFYKRAIVDGKPKLVAAKPFNYQEPLAGEISLQNKKLDEHKTKLLYLQNHCLVNILLNPERTGYFARNINKEFIVRINQLIWAPVLKKPGLEEKRRPEEKRSSLAARPAFATELAELNALLNEADIYLTDAELQAVVAENQRLRKVYNDIAAEEVRAAVVSQDTPCLLKADFNKDWKPKKQDVDPLRFDSDGSLLQCLKDFYTEFGICEPRFKEIVEKIDANKHPEIYQICVALRENAEKLPTEVALHTVEAYGNKFCGYDRSPQELYDLLLERSQLLQNFLDASKKITTFTPKVASIKVSTAAELKDTKERLKAHLAANIALLPEITNRLSAHDLVAHRVAKLQQISNELSILHKTLIDQWPTITKDLAEIAGQLSEIKFLTLFATNFSSRARLALLKKGLKDKFESINKASADQKHLHDLYEFMLQLSNANGHLAYLEQVRKGHPSITEQTAVKETEAFFAKFNRGNSDPIDSWSQIRIAAQSLQLQDKDFSRLTALDPHQELNLIKQLHPHETKYEELSDNLIDTLDKELAELIKDAEEKYKTLSADEAKYPTAETYFAMQQKAYQQKVALAPCALKASHYISKTKQLSSELYVRREELKRIYNDSFEFKTPADRKNFNDAQKEIPKLSARILNLGKINNTESLRQQLIAQLANLDQLQAKHKKLYLKQMLLHPMLMQMLDKYPDLLSDDPEKLKVQVEQLNAILNQKLNLTQLKEKLIALQFNLTEEDLAEVDRFNQIVAELYYLHDYLHDMSAGSIPREELTAQMLAKVKEKDFHIKDDNLMNFIGKLASLAKKPIEVLTIPKPSAAVELSPRTTPLELKDAKEVKAEIKVASLVSIDFEPLHALLDKLQPDQKIILKDDKYEIVATSSLGGKKGVSEPTVAAFNKILTELSNALAVGLFDQQLFFKLLASQWGINVIKNNPTLLPQIKILREALVKAYAENCCAMSRSLFQQIGNEEMLVSTNKLQDPANKNRLAFSNYVERIPQYVVESILANNNPNYWALIIEQWVAIAIEVASKGDFNSMVAIENGLRSNAVDNIKTKIAPYLSAKTKSYLEEIYSRNYASNTTFRVFMEGYGGPIVPTLTAYLPLYDKIKEMSAESKAAKELPDVAAILGKMQAKVKKAPTVRVSSLVLEAELSAKPVAGYLDEAHGKAKKLTQDLDLAETPYASPFLNSNYSPASAVTNKDLRDYLNLHCHTFDTKIADEQIIVINKLCAGEFASKLPAERIDELSSLLQSLTILVPQPTLMSLYSSVDKAYLYERSKNQFEIIVRMLPDIEALENKSLKVDFKQLREQLARTATKKITEVLFKSYQNNQVALEKFIAQLIAELTKETEQATELRLAYEVKIENRATRIAATDVTLVELEGMAAELAADMEQLKKVPAENLLALFNYSDKFLPLIDNEAQRKNLKSLIIGKDKQQNFKYFNVDRGPALNILLQQKIHIEQAVIKLKQNHLDLATEVKEAIVEHKFETKAELGTMAAKLLRFAELDKLNQQIEMAAAQVAEKLAKINTSIVALGSAADSKVVAAKASLEQQQLQLAANKTKITAQITALGLRKDDVVAELGKVHRFTTMVDDPTIAGSAERCLAREFELLAENIDKLSDSIVKCANLPTIATDRIEKLAKEAQEIIAVAERLQASAIEQKSLALAIQAFLHPISEDEHKNMLAIVEVNLAVISAGFVGLTKDKEVSFADGKKVALADLLVNVKKLLTDRQSPVLPRQLERLNEIKNDLDGMSVEFKRDDKSLTALQRQHATLKNNLIKVNQYVNILGAEFAKVGKDSRDPAKIAFAETLALAQVKQAAIQEKLQKIAQNIKEQQAADNKQQAASKIFAEKIMPALHVAIEYAVANDYSLLPLIAEILVADDPLTKCTNQKAAIHKYLKQLASLLNDIKPLHKTIDGIHEVHKMVVDTYTNRMNEPATKIVDMFFAHNKPLKKLLSATPGLSITLEGLKRLQDNLLLLEDLNAGNKPTNKYRSFKLACKAKNLTVAEYNHICALENAHYLGIDLATPAELAELFNNYAAELNEHAREFFALNNNFKQLDSSKDKRALRKNAGQQVDYPIIGQQLGQISEDFAAKRTLLKDLNIKFARYQLVAADKNIKLVQHKNIIDQLNIVIIAINNNCMSWAKHVMAQFNYGVKIAANLLDNLQKITSARKTTKEVKQDLQNTLNLLTQLLAFLPDATVMDAQELSSILQRLNLNDTTIIAIVEMQGKIKQQLSALQSENIRLAALMSVEDKREDKREVKREDKKVATQKQYQQVLSSEQKRSSQTRVEVQARLERKPVAEQDVKIRPISKSVLAIPQEKTTPAAKKPLKRNVATAPLKMLSKEQVIVEKARILQAMDTTTVVKSESNNAAVAVMVTKYGHQIKVDHQQNTVSATIGGKPKTDEYEDSVRNMAKKLYDEADSRDLLNDRRVNFEKGPMQHRQALALWIRAIDEAIIEATMLNIPGAKKMPIKPSIEIDLGNKRLFSPSILERGKISAIKKRLLAGEFGVDVLKPRVAAADARNIIRHTIS